MGDESRKKPFRMRSHSLMLDYDEISPPTLERRVSSLTGSPNRQLLLSTSTDSSRDSSPRDANGLRAVGTSEGSTPRSARSLFARARSPRTDAGIMTPRRRKSWGGWTDETEASEESSGSYSSPRNGRHLIDLNHCQIQKYRLLGSGGTSEVYSGMVNGFSVAIKIYRDGAIQEVQDEISREIEMMITICHDRIIRCLGYRIEDPDQMMLFLELCHGTLRDLIDNQRKIPAEAFSLINSPIAEVPEEDDHSLESEEVQQELAKGWMCQPFKSRQVVNYMSQIAEGLIFLHELKPKIIHRDLKSENIFFVQLYGQEMPSLKIGDFGEALLKIKKKKREPNVGTLEFRAPEMFSEEKEKLVRYNEKVDIWSLGMILFELLTLELPYRTEYGRDHFRIAEAIQSGKKPLMPRRGSRIRERVLPILYEQCTQVNPKDRPTARSINERFLNFLANPSGSPVVETKS